MAEQNGDKRFPASEQRRRKAREQGQVVRSQDLASAALLLAALAVIANFGRPMVAELSELLAHSLADSEVEVFTVDSASGLLSQTGYFTLLAIGPIMISMFVCAVLAHILQTGPLLLPDKLLPKFSNISPMQGLKRIFALPNFMRLAFGIFKLAVIATVAGFCVVRWYQAIFGISGLGVAAVGKMIFDATFSTCLWIGVALFLLAAFDFAFQWWKHEQDMMMTEQEIRDEMKENEGDPQVIARRRQVQRQLAMQRMNTDVPGADVVVTNPTELAIAIKYDPETMAAPIVAAKGAGLLAQRIRRIALEHGIAIVERKPLAQALYKHVEIGHPVPHEQYQAVAEVLRYVYQLEGREAPKAA
ncbi:MAG: EscU/YscU/HrcU family type III secretion system export apparatus switch protein [Pirellulaceae bacterium]